MTKNTGRKTETKINAEINEEISLYLHKKREKYTDSLLFHL